jgi:hypothetical protein
LNAFLAERPEVCHLIAGHTHDGKMITVENGDRTVIYYNSGTAIRQMRTSKPEVRTITAWPKVETFFRRVLYYWLHAPWKAVGSTLAYAFFPVAIFMLPELPVLTTLRWPIALVALFLLLWWQFAAEYREGHFLHFTPVEVLMYDEGPPQVRILQYDHERRRFHLLTGEDAAWDHQ